MKLKICKATRYNLYPFSLAKNKVYVYLFIFNQLHRGISARANMSGTDHIHKAKHKHSQHLSCSKNANNSLMREGTSAGNLKVSLSPITQETRDETYLFRTVPEVHDHGQVPSLPSVFHKGIIAANHSHILSYKLSNKWTHCRNYYRLILYQCTCHQSWRSTANTRINTYRKLKQSK